MSKISKEKGSALPRSQKDLINRHKTLLEQLYDKGWLENSNSSYSSDARLRAGLRLIYNYQILKRNNLHSGYIFNSKIDASTSLDARIYNDALDFYRRCLRAVPAEFWQIVRLICLEEKMPPVFSEISERKQSHINYSYRMDLCRGLDRIISMQLKIDNNINY